MIYHTIGAVLEKESKMSKKLIRIYATEIVEHIWTVEEDNSEDAIKKIEEDNSWLVNSINSDSYSREHVRVHHLDFVN